jgi:hypothetical protein
MEVFLVIGFVFGVVVAGAVSGLIMSFRAESLSETVLLDELIRKRSNRYIAAVAKKTTEDEIEAGSKKQATQRLAEHGVKPQSA